MDIKEMEKAVQKLMDIAEIEKLQGKYFRCLDTKAWDELGEVFADEINTSFSDGRLVFHKYADLRKFYEDNMDPEQQVGQHNGHTPEIDVIDEDTAKAKWYLNDYLIIFPAKWGIRGTAIYDIVYKKINGEWKIRDIGYQRIFEESWSRENYEKRKVTENMFDKSLGHKSPITMEKKN